MAGLLLLPALVPASAQEAPDDAARVARALAWLAGKPADQRGYATNVVEALAQAGIDPKGWPTPEANEFARLGPYDSGNGEYYSHLRVAHAAGTAGYDPRNVHGVDYVALVRAGFSAGQSGSPTYLNDDAWAILALVAAGVDPADEQVRASAGVLERAQRPDGGWGYALTSFQSSTDTTGMALAALAAAGKDLAPFSHARSYLDGTFDAARGGHGDGQGIGANCQSTVWALHGYHLLGVPARPESLAFLRQLQNADGGFGTSRDAKGKPTPSNAFCTAEAVVLLAGARYPLPAYAPAPAPDPVHALEPASPAVDGSFERVAWTWQDPDVRETLDGMVFPRSGAFAYSLFAEGQGVRHRSEGNLTVLSARPLASAPTQAHALRRVPFALDLSASRDPDGVIRLVEVAWGDGAATTGADLAPAHTYGDPGEHLVRVRVRDDAGFWSDEVLVAVTVANRPPVLQAPADLVADRTRPLVFLPEWSDPEGDPVVVSWRVGNASGEGVVHASLLDLGNHTLELAARDPHGGEATASVRVEVVNLPPRLVNLSLPISVRADEPFPFHVEASDEDGPAPTVQWRLGPLVREGTQGEARLPAGDHEVVLSALDADGALVRHHAVLRVLSPEAEARPAESVPEVRDLQARLEGGALHLAFALHPPDALANVSWTSDVGDGSIELPSGEHRVPLPGATRAEARIELRAGAAVATVRTPLLRAPRPALASPEGPAEAVLAQAGSPLRLAFAPVDGAFEHRLDFGDGALTPWTPRPEATHAWETPGDYVLTVHARAEDGRTSSAAFRVHVATAVRQPLPLEATAPEDSVGVESTPEEDSRPNAEAGPLSTLEGAELLSPGSARREAPGAPLVVAALAASAISRGWSGRGRP